jgi:hypothetical protein
MDGSEEREASQDAWDSSAWNGDINELRRRLDSMTIPHELQCEISLILDHAQPARYAELLAFLFNTASQLSQSAREELLQLNMNDTATEYRRCHSRTPPPTVSSTHCAFM